MENGQHEKSHEVGSYSGRWCFAVFIQCMVGQIPLMSKISKWGGSFLHVGVLGLIISAVFSEYTSQFLYAHYQTWAGWRSIAGSDPNSFTLIIQKITWAVFFVSCWFMLWKLDCFFLPPPPQVEEPAKEEDLEENGAENRVRKKRKRKDPTCEEEEKVVVETNEDLPPPPEKNSDETTDNLFTDEDYAFAEILGLSKPIELSVIKSTYRKTIAQYHPDRVMAMGPEIKEVAEKKAKEINEAYEHFRKKFDLN